MVQPSDRQENNHSLKRSVSFESTRYDTSLLKPLDEKSISSRTAFILVLKKIKVSIRDFFSNLGLSIKEKIISLFEVTKKTDEVSQDFFKRLSTLKDPKQRQTMLELERNRILANVPERTEEEAKNILNSIEENVYVEYKFKDFSSEDIHYGIAFKNEFFDHTADPPSKKTKVLTSRLSLKTPEDFSIVKGVKSMRHAYDASPEEIKLREQGLKLHPLFLRQKQLAEIQEKMPENSYLLVKSNISPGVWFVSTKVNNDSEKTLKNVRITSENISEQIKLIKDFNLIPYEPQSGEDKISELAYNNFSKDPNV